MRFWFWIIFIQQPSEKNRCFKNFQHICRKAKKIHLNQIQGKSDNGQINQIFQVQHFLRLTINFPHLLSKLKNKNPWLERLSRENIRAKIFIGLILFLRITKTDND